MFSGLEIQRFLVPGCPDRVLIALIGSFNGLRLGAINNWAKLRGLRKTTSIRMSHNIFANSFCSMSSPIRVRTCHAGNPFGSYGVINGVFSHLETCTGIDMGDCSTRG
jgi:hypothetical protein